MNRIHLILLSSFLIISSCKGTKTEDIEVAKITSERIAIDDELKEDNEITEFIAPFKDHLNKTLDSVIAYNPTLLSKNDGDLNTALGNLMADVVMIQANPVIKKRTGRDIDFVLLNHGGIRSELPEGGVTSRSAYNLMPFENEIVVAELSGKKVKEFLKYLEKAKTAHPVSGIKIKADRNYKITKASVKGKEVDENKTYLVATSDYLYNGGDNMKFFKDPVNLYGADYKIRNALIDYFNKVDTIRTQIDDRYIRD
ncbi:MAG: 5'-nucleotidase [Christiangramia sp.]|nr:5'-nucleotidase [Christiangramia sp.]